MMEDALTLQEEGVFAILLEAMPAEPAGQIAKKLHIPIYGIGAGPLTDGQLVIMHDLLGFYQPFRPWFAKCFIPDVLEEFREYLSGIEDIRKHGREERRDGLLVLAEMAVKRYVQEVRARQFPGKEFTYSIKEAELAELRESPLWVG